MKKLILILTSAVLALATASLTACAGNTTKDLPSDSGVSDIAKGEPEKDAQPDSDTEADSAEPEMESDDYVDTINAQTADAMGECGENVSWYYKDGVLVVRGVGDMYDYKVEQFECDAPWYTYNGRELIENIQSVIIGHGVTSVGENAFCFLDHLSRLELSDTVEKIGSGAFNICGGLTAVSFPESLRVIGAKAFYGCLNLTSIAIPTTVEEIGQDAFADCDNADVILPEGLTQVDIEHAFSCTKSVTIPAGVTKIDGFGGQHFVTFLGDAPEIAIYEVKNDYGEIIGKAIKGMIYGLNYETGEPYETGVTIYYSGEGFEKYIEMFPQYQWVKKPRRRDQTN